MARISQIWAQSVTDFVAVQHSDFTPDAGGYAAAEAYLVANGGGVLYVGAGLESLAPAPPANVVVVRMRSGSAPGMEMWGNLILPAGFSIRATDSAGTRRTVLTPILDAINGDTLRIAYLNSLQGLLLTDQNAVEKARLTASRLKLGAGVDLAPNNLPGVLGQILLSRGPAASAGWLGGGALNQVLTHQGAGVDPAWVAPAASGTKYQILRGTDFLNGATAPHNSGGSTKYMSDSESGGGATPTADYILYTYPGDFTSTVAWRILFTATGDFGGPNTITYQLSMVKWAAALDILAAAFTDGAQVNVTPPSAANVLGVGVLPEPAITPVAGDMVWVKKSRFGNTDTSAFASQFLGLVHVYN